MPGHGDGSHPTIKCFEGFAVSALLSDKAESSNSQSQVSVPNACAFWHRIAVEGQRSRANESIRHAILMTLTQPVQPRLRRTSIWAHVTACVMLDLDLQIEVVLEAVQVLRAHSLLAPIFKRKRSVRAEFEPRASLLSTAPGV